MEILLSFIIGAFISAGIICTILIPKVKHRESLNTEIIAENEKAKKNLDKWNQSADHFKSVCEVLIAEKAQLEEALRDKKANFNLQFEQYVQNLKKEYDRAEDEYISEYENILKDYVEAFQQNNEKELAKVKKIELEIANKTAEMADLKAKVDAAISANKRVAEMENKQDFYRINLSQEDLSEIAELKDAAKHLRNAEPLNKVIWKVYYEKPTNDMIGRVVGTGRHIGIYKITNLKNGMCYVGQTSASGGFADRWKQHIRRGIGADTPTRNKLYPAMLAFGVENFSFEIIEECSTEKLNEREQYWQEFFGAKEFGYSIK